jgi:hypothetical protein
MQLHTFMPGFDVARCMLLLISTPPFQSGDAGKHAPKIITCILYGVMIPYGKFLVKFARGGQGIFNVRFPLLGGFIWVISRATVATPPGAGQQQQN